MKRTWLFALLCVASFAAAAKDGGMKPLQISAILTQQQEIRQGVLSQTGIYKDMPAATRSDLLSRQQTLLNMLEGKQSADELTDDQKMQAFNTLEWIEGAINRAEDERMVCRREKPLGSTRTVRTCRTARDEREARERARDELENNNHFETR